MGFFASVLLAMALSIDSFGVGLAYGIKQVKISFFPIIILVLCSAIAMSISLYAGQLVAGYIPNHSTGVVGGSILILIGLWQLIEGWKNYQISKLLESGEKGDPILLTINLKIFGLVLQVLREPVKADLDKSGDIDYKEAIILGFALNIDAMGAGLGAGIAGCSFVLIPSVAIALFLSLQLGLLVGKRFAMAFLGEKGFVLPGLMLICLGLLNIMK